MNASTGWSPHYPLYKDSGVAWLGQIPAHWEIQQLKSFTSFVSRGSSPNYVDESSILVINQACVYWNGLNLGNIKYQQEENITDWKGVLYSGDLLINSTGTGTLGRAAVFNEKGQFIADSHITIVRLQKGYPYYFYYLIQTPIYQDYIYSALVSGSTNQIELSKEGLLATTFIFPPLTEQNAIAKFLNRETAKIDELITEFEKLVTLLAEKRRAVINHAVTYGIFPNVELRDSGIGWIGKIPLDWEIVKIKYVSRLGNGSTPLRDNKDYWDGGTFPWLTSTVVNENIIGEPQQFVTKQALQECHLPIVRPNSVLVAITGQGKTRGMSGILQYTATINQHLAFISPELNLLNPGFLHLYLSSVYEVLRAISEGSGSTRGAITIEQLSEFPVILPPLKEQLKIVAYLEAETAPIDQLGKNIQETIQLLQERRSALITAAVSGKIQVIE